MRNVTEDGAWEAYCASEQVMFEAAAEQLKPYSPEALRLIKENAEENGSDIGVVIEMMLGEKPVPEGWNVPVVV